MDNDNHLFIKGFNPLTLLDIYDQINNNKKRGETNLEKICYNLYLVSSCLYVYSADR